MRAEYKLHQACRWGNLEEVTLLLKHPGIDINCLDKDCNTPRIYGTTSHVYAATPLYVACMRGRLEVVQALLEVDGVDVNIPSKNGTTPLQRACMFGNSQVVRALLDVNDIDVNLRDDLGRTALYFASNSGHVEVVRALLDVDGIDVTRPGGGTGDSPFHRACLNGHIEVARVLLDQDGIDCNTLNRFDHSPLDAACSKDHLEMVCFLLDSLSQLDVNAWSMLSLLLKKRSDNRISRILFLPAINGKCLEGILKCIIDHPHSSKLDVMKALICSQKLPVRNKVNAFVTAARNGHAAAVSLFLTAGFDINSSNEHGNTALHQAVLRSKINVVRALVANDKLNLNCQNEDGRTPLMFALERRPTIASKGILTLLLEQPRCYLHIRTTKGGTAMDSLVADKEDFLTIMCDAAIKRYKRRESLKKQFRTFLLCQQRVSQNLNAPGLARLAAFPVDQKRKFLGYLLPFGIIDLVVPVLFRTKSLCLAARLLCKMGSVGVSYPSSFDGLLFDAAKKGNISAVTALLNLGGIDINYSDQSGNTALKIASYNGHIGVVKALLKEGCIDVNCKSNDGCTPLYAACRIGHVEVVRALLEADGIDVNYPFRKAFSPLYIACLRVSVRSTTS